MVTFNYIDLSIKALNGNFNLIVNIELVFKKYEAMFDWKLEIEFWEHDIMRDDSIIPLQNPLITIKPKFPDPARITEELTIHRRYVYEVTKSELNRDFGEEEIYAILKIHPPKLELVPDRSHYVPIKIK